MPVPRPSRASLRDDGWKRSRGYRTAHGLLRLRGAWASGFRGGLRTWGQPLSRRPVSLWWVAEPTRRPSTRVSTTSRPSRSRRLSSLPSERRANKPLRTIAISSLAQMTMTNTRTPIRARSRSSSRRWTGTACGSTTRRTARSGCRHRRRSAPTSSLTSARAIGRTATRATTSGSRTTRGVGRRSTTDGGRFCPAMAGRGSPAAATPARGSRGARAHRATGTSVGRRWGRATIGLAARRSVGPSGTTILTSITCIVHTVTCTRAGSRRTSSAVPRLVSTTGERTTTSPRRRRWAGRGEFSPARASTVTAVSSRVRAWGVVPQPRRRSRADLVRRTSA